MKTSKLTILFMIWHQVFWQVVGKPYCTDPTAPNYNPDATKDDGSCEELVNEYLISGTLTEDKTLDASLHLFRGRESNCSQWRNIKYPCWHNY